MKKIGIGAEGPQAFWNLPGRRDNGRVVTLPADAEAIFVDPGASSPNVMIAVRTPDSEEPIMLMPGDVMPLTEACKIDRNLRIYNAYREILQGVGSADDQLVDNVGYLRLLSLSASEVAVFQGGGQIRRSRGGLATLVGRMRCAIGGPDPRVVVVPTYGLSALRVTATPLASGAPRGYDPTGGVTIPADLAMTLTPLVLVPGISATTPSVLPATSSLIESVASAAGSGRDTTLAEAITATRNVVEWRINTPGLLAIMASGCATATAVPGITDIMLTVEGVAL